MQKVIQFSPFWLSAILILGSFLQWSCHDKSKTRVRQVQWYNDKNEPVRTNDRDPKQASYPDILSPQGGNLLGLFHHQETGILWTMQRCGDQSPTPYQVAFLDLANQRGQVLPFPKNMPITNIWGLAPHPGGHIAIIFESHNRYALAVVHHQQGLRYASFLSDEPHQELLAALWQGKTLHIAITKDKRKTNNKQTVLQSTFIIADTKQILERNLFQKDIFPNSYRNRIVGIFMTENFWEFVVETISPGSRHPEYFQLDLQGNYQPYKIQTELPPPYFFYRFPQGCFQAFARSPREAIIFADGSNQMLLHYLKDFNCPRNGFVSINYAASNEKFFISPRYHFYQKRIIVRQKIDNNWLELTEIKQDKAYFAAIKHQGKTTIIGKTDHIGDEGSFVNYAMIIKQEHGYSIVSPMGYYISLNKNFERIDPYSFWKNLSFRHNDRNAFRKPYSAVYLMMWCLLGLFVCLSFSLLGYWLYGKKEGNPVIQHLQWGASIYLLSGGFCYWLLSPLF